VHCASRLPRTSFPLPCSTNICRLKSEIWS